jgi:hypothetical protein
VLDLSSKKEADIQTALNALGAQKWELVAVVRREFYFKRPCAEVS